MKIPFAEPLSPRYIYINPETNHVHLLVPLVQGQEISTDNTCKSTVALTEFKNAALNELNTYKSALEFDLELLGDDDSPLKALKETRLTQINAYINAMPPMQEKYSSAITSQMSKTSSNLYSIQLRPLIQDPQSIVVNPVFSIKRTNDVNMTPKSVLFNTMYEAYPQLRIAPLDPKSQLDAAVLMALPGLATNFTEIQAEMTTQCQRLFGLAVDFTKAGHSTPVSQAYIDATMEFSPAAPATTQEYIDALWNACAPNIGANIATKPFYSVPNNQDKTEKLSILTQFFLAHVNIYCKSKGIVHENFGVILDASPDLSDKVAFIVSSSLENGWDVENNLCTFFNQHIDEFALTRPLLQTDMQAIQEKFERTYKTVTATKENPYMDDFMILDTDAVAGQFVTHQGSICTDFANLVDPSLDNTLFQTIRRDFEAPIERLIPNKNEHIQASIDLDIETLLSRIKDDDQFKKLPPKIQMECLKSPAFQLRTFLHDIAKGNQEKADKLLTENPERTQELLNSHGTFTDYSGRTFNCTAYEYAYWAKDTHMRRMLEPRMDEATKVAMRTRIDGIERDGLTYSQHGAEINSKHFDLTKLTTALQNYVDGYDNWERTDNWDAKKAAWMQVGLAQRDVPVHVMNEYCRPDRSFAPVPPALKLEFDETSLPRVLTFYNYATGSDSTPVFPLDVSSIAGLGFEFSLFSVEAGSAGACLGPDAVPGAAVGLRMALIDLAAVSRLDEVRTADLTQSRENLGLIAQEPDHPKKSSWNLLK